MFVNYSIGGSSICVWVKLAVVGIPLGRETRRIPRLISLDIKVFQFGGLAHGSKNVAKITPHCWASEKSFSVSPPASCVVSVNFTLS